MSLQGKHIVLGVSGGVAAFKAVDVCRRLVEAGAHVSPILTSNALRFVGAATFSALASEPASIDLYDGREVSPHTRLGQSADLVLIVPATANVISVAATGAARDLLGATLLATRAPVMMCPAMHTEMWEHAAVQENVATLKRRGVLIVEPDVGLLAGGDVGAGRLAAPERIVAAVTKHFAQSNNDQIQNADLAELTVLITAGGTREPVDPVRYLGNRSSGKQGHALAANAVARGAKVHLVTASPLDDPNGCHVVRVDTADEMHRAVCEFANDADVVVMAAAVADFRPVRVATDKIKKTDGVPTVELEPTVDILAEVAGRRVPGQTVVGFCAETSDVIGHALDKLKRKGLDVIVANDVSEANVGFSHDTNAVAILDATGERHDVPLANKQDVAAAVWDAVIRYRLTSPSNAATNR